MLARIVRNRLVDGKNADQVTQESKEIWLADGRRCKENVLNESKKDGLRKRQTRSFCKLI